MDRRDRGCQPIIHAVVDWTVGRAEELGGVGGRVVVGGSSAGGGSCFAVALRMVEMGRGQQVAGIVAQVPVTIHPDYVPEGDKARYTAYEEHAEHTLNTKKAMQVFWGRFLCSSLLLASPIP